MKEENLKYVSQVDKSERKLSDEQQRTDQAFKIKNAALDDQNNTFSEIQQQDGVISLRQSEEYFTQQQTHRMQNKFTQELPDSSNNQSIQQTSFSVTKMENECFKYSQELILASQKFQSNGLKATQIKELAERAIINIVPETKNENISRAFRCLRVNDFSSLSQQGKKKKRRNIGKIQELSVRESSLIREAQEASLKGIYQEQYSKNQASQRSVNTFGINESVDPSKISMNASKIYKFDALDKLNKGLESQRRSVYGTVPVKMKTVFQKVSSRTTENSPRLKRRGARYAKQILGVSNDDSDGQKYKLPSMSQFIQKSILPKKQAIINDIYISKLSKVQNLLSIVGDGNIKLANNLISHNEDFNIQKSLLKEMERQKLREKQRKIQLTIQKSLDYDENQLLSPNGTPNLDDLLKAKALNGFQLNEFNKLGQNCAHDKNQDLSLKSPQGDTNESINKRNLVPLTDQQFIHSLSSHYHDNQKDLLKRSYQVQNAASPLDDKGVQPSKQSQQISNSPLRMTEGHNYLNRTQVFFKKISIKNNNIQDHNKNLMPLSSLNSDLHQIVSTAHTNHDIIKNYRGMLKQNFKNKSSQHTQSLVISPSISRTQVRKNSQNSIKSTLNQNQSSDKYLEESKKVNKDDEKRARHLFHFGLSSQEFEQRRKNLNSTIEKRQTHLFSRDSARHQANLGLNDQKNNNSPLNSNDIQYRDRYHRERKIRFNQKLVNFQQRGNSVPNGQTKVSDVIASQLKTNSTNYMLMSLNRILNSKSSQRAVRPSYNKGVQESGSKSPSRRSLVMIKKNGTIQQKSRHYIPVKSISQNEDLEVEEEDYNQDVQKITSEEDEKQEQDQQNQGEGYILQYDGQSKIFSHQDLLQQLSKESSKEIEIKSSMKELEFYREMRRNNGNHSKQSTPSPNMLLSNECILSHQQSKKQGVQYKQMPLVNYKFPIESSTRLKDQKSSLKAFTPSLPIRVHISKEKKQAFLGMQGTQSNQDLTKLADLQNKQTINLQVQVLSLPGNLKSPVDSAIENNSARKGQDSPTNSHKKNIQAQEEIYQKNHSPKISPTFVKRNFPLRSNSPESITNRFQLSIQGSPQYPNSGLKNQSKIDKAPHFYEMQLVLNNTDDHQTFKVQNQQQFNSILSQNWQREKKQSNQMRKSGQWQLRQSSDKKGAINRQQLSLHITDQANNMNEVTLERQTLDEREIQSDDKEAVYLKLRNSLKQNSSSKNSGIYRFNEDLIFPKSSSGKLSDQLRKQGGQSVKSQGKQLQLMLLNTSLVQQIDPTLDSKEKVAQSVRQRVNINKALGLIIQNSSQIPENASSSTSINKQKSRFKRLGQIHPYGHQGNFPVTFMGEEQLIGEDDLSSKALNSTTFFKQLENRYQNSQLLENFNQSPQNNISQTNIITGQGGFSIKVRSDLQSLDDHKTIGVRSGAGINSVLGLATEEEMQQYRMDPQFVKKSDRGVMKPIERQGYQYKELDRFRPVQLKGQVFSMPISPKNKGEIELKKKRQHIFKSRAIDGGNPSQVISSNLVHKQFQMNNNHSKDVKGEKSQQNKKLNQSVIKQSQIKSASIQLSI